MSAIGVKEAATIGSQHLDHLLRGDWAERDGLLGAFECRGIDIGAERLRHSLPNEEERYWNANRYEDIEGDAGHIDPEIADSADGMARETADQRHRQGDAGRRRQIILMSQAEHLHEIG